MLHMLYLTLLTALFWTGPAQAQDDTSSDTELRRPPAELPESKRVKHSKCRL